jgi:hypothetical protein
MNGPSLKAGLNSCRKVISVTLPSMDATGPHYCARREPVKIVLFYSRNSTDRPMKPSSINLLYQIAKLAPAGAGTC